MTKETIYKYREKLGDFKGPIIYPLNGQLSLARHWGTCTINGRTFFQVEDVLVRDDVLAEVNKLEKKEREEKHDTKGRIPDDSWPSLFRDV